MRFWSTFVALMVLAVLPIGQGSVPPNRPLKRNSVVKANAVPVLQPQSGSRRSQSTLLSEKPTSSVGRSPSKKKASTPTGGPSSPQFAKQNSSLSINDGLDEDGFQTIDILSTYPPLPKNYYVTILFNDENDKMIIWRNVLPADKSFNKSLAEYMETVSQRFQIPSSKAHYRAHRHYDALEHFNNPNNVIAYVSDEVLYANGKTEIKDMNATIRDIVVSRIQPVITLKVTLSQKSV